MSTAGYDAIVLHVYWAPLTAFTASLLVNWWLVNARLGLDHPNLRSLHHVPIPRSGGLGVQLGVLLAAMMIGPGLPWTLWAAWGVMIVISLVDDLRDTPALGRLITHLIAAGAFAFGELFEHAGFLYAVFATLALTWMANLFNFMDGSDGLAGGMAVSGFAFYGVAAWHAGDTGFALLNISIAAAAGAFLAFNFHPARIFLGDVGSVPLGFLAGAFGVLGWLSGKWTLWFPALLFSPFIADASVTLARRLLRGEEVWRAHREHYYQRLVRIGWGHRKTAIAEYFLMLAAGSSALLGLEWPQAAQAGLCAVWLAIYVVLMRSIDRSWSQHAQLPDNAVR
jgi:UDP-GlcNAc:undecaprenyl-phosphate/decaprenyl-phosphate GlcNAc-1-phosphate transferase